MPTPRQMLTAPLSWRPRPISPPSWIARTAVHAARKTVGVLIKGLTMFYSADEITSGPYDHQELNFGAVVAELLPDSANCHENADDTEYHGDARLSDDLEDEQ